MSKPRRDMTLLRHEKELCKSENSIVGRCRHLTTQGDMAAYVEAALEDVAPALVAQAPGDLARGFRLRAAADV